MNEGALLELALTQYAMSKAIARGFKPVITPDVVRADIASRCGFQPRDTGDPPVHQMYHLQKTHSVQPELVLSGTAEIPLAGMFANKIFHEEELPMKYVGLGRAFRSEAGARGADTRGLYRVHQFTKVELFTACAEGESERLMQEFLDLQLDIFGDLGIPIRCDFPLPLQVSCYDYVDLQLGSSTCPLRSLARVRTGNTILRHGCQGVVGGAKYRQRLIARTISQDDCTSVIVDEKHRTLKRVPTDLYLLLIP